MILTGTPLETTTDLWTQMTFANPGLLGSQSYFRSYFQIPIEKHNDEQRMRKLYALIKPFMRRHKSQVALDLPPKVESVHYCEMAEEQEQRYEETKSYYRNFILEHIEEKGVSKSQIVVLQGLTKLRQLANHPRMIDESYEGESGKLEEIQSKLEELMSENHKVLIFSQFIRHLAILRRYLDEKEIRYAYLDGSTTDRQAQVELFQQDETIKIFLISLKAGGLGLNLTAADYVFILTGGGILPLKRRLLTVLTALDSKKRYLPINLLPKIRWKKKFWIYSEASKNSLTISLRPKKAL